MNIDNSLLEVANLSIAASVFFWGIIQWYLAVRADRRRRDTSLTAWGFEVMETMSELHSIASFTRSPEVVSSTAERLAWHSSALVEQGRVFFPNVHPDKSHNGFRPKLLDEVVRCTIIAEYLREHPDAAPSGSLKNQIWAARKAFRRDLQRKIHLTLLHVDEKDIGDFISPDPTTWPDRESVSRRE